jgi:AcrR family transcriptional regulator
MDEPARNIAPAQSKVQRGRPSRFTRGQIVEAALDLLSESGVANFSMHGLARRLDAPVMTFYAYFPNRRALLTAVAAHVFERFEQPDRLDAAKPWRDALRSRMAALTAHLRRYPVTAALIMSQEHDERSWLRVWLPVGRVLYAQGLRGADLAFAASWFSVQAWSLITPSIRPPASAPIEAMFDLPTEDAADTLVIREMRDHYHPVDNARMLDFGFETLLDGLARLIDEARTARSQPAA